MSVTYGLPGMGSSESADLQSSLESRLRARLESGGSTLYELTWKTVDMPSPPSISALRASGRRTSDSGFGGWATPRTVTGGAESGAREQELGRTESGGGDLQSQALMSGWATPTSRDWKDGVFCPNVETNGLLGRQVWDTTGWPTPSAIVYGEDVQKEVERRKRLKAKHGNGNGAGLTLGVAAQMAGWPTATASDAGGASSHYRTWSKTQCNLHNVTMGVGKQQGGQVLPGSNAPTDSQGRSLRLNPRFSGWLQGYPSAWCHAAPVLSARQLKAASASSGDTATPSSPK